MPVLSTEITFLLDACSVRQDLPPPERPPDLDHLARLAWVHRVAPLVYHHRARLGLSEAEAAPFRTLALSTLHRNLQLAAELKMALQALNAAGVPTLLLKGAHLMDAVYANPALRPMSDLDLLIRPEHAASATSALADCGYDADPVRSLITNRLDREMRLDKKGVHELHIELHTDLNRPTRHHWFPMDALWERSVAYAMDDVPARVLSPEDNAVFLCAHAVPHMFHQLIWLRDIAGLMSSELEPDRLYAVARDARAVRALQTGLALAADLMQAPLPTGFSATTPRIAALLCFDTPRYSTLTSLRFRAALADSPADATSILAAALGRKVAEALGRRSAAPSRH